ncbi:fungal-specific transcription factor domain-containing protein [Penicillium waksmanii]|uniref:fungal-specific transcription factor domain-containing protein n=1 Tax=Penicillium waksmanii TaxID=69791 RepID=UPI0025497740|nr:fungal-specific transcription factor domain-containing protein [Penicillium waksmanii]KAJ5999942.1 fungal-specific transcription factor domain-containing protein [Penicillium waksmanii]
MKSFDCPSCDRGFSRRENLSRHKKTLYPPPSTAEINASQRNCQRDDTEISNLTAFTDAYFCSQDGISLSRDAWDAYDFSDILYEAAASHSNEDGDISISREPVFGVGRNEFPASKQIVSVNLAQDTSGNTTPPSQPNNEEPCPFASASPSTQAQPISVEENDPLLQNHNPRFDIGKCAWTTMRQGLASSSTPNQPFTMPSLEVTNAFIGLFFKRFAHICPVLHESTLDTNSLPPALLTVMMAIGALHSQLRNTRPLAMLVLEQTRINTQTAIETDRTLVYDPLTLYTYTLICYACLWCGNRRLFEIAETLRGSLVTFIRRFPKHRNAVDPLLDLKDRWSDWIRAETQWRLKWAVFMIDAQFPVLLNMKSMLSISEIARWPCPCDEEYWAAPTALAWRNLLGTAPSPPAPDFAMAYAPFACYLWSRTPLRGLPPSRINRWSSFLVVLSLSHMALEWAHDWDLAVTMVSLTTEEDEMVDALSRGQDNGEYRLLAEDRKEIIGALERWYIHHGNRHGVGYFEQSPVAQASFGEAALQVYHLTRILLHVSISDLQDSIGEARNQGLSTVMPRLKAWSQIQGFGYVSWPGDITDGAVVSQAVGTAAEAATVIVNILSGSSEQYATPYSIILVFLSYLILWTFSITAPDDLKLEFLQLLQQLSVSSQVGQQLQRVMKPALERAIEVDSEEARSILRHAVPVLAKMKTWGASLSLSLLLLRHT